MKTNKSQTKSLCYVLAYLILIPNLAFADVAETLSNFLDYLTGTWGKIVAAIAIVAIGYACFFLGKVPRFYVVSVVVGVGLVFGAQQVLQHIAGQ